MAVLYIAEYSRLISAPNSVPQVPDEESLLAEQTLAIGAGSVPSAPFNALTRIVRLHCDAVCSVKFGIAPTAAATNQRMAANQTEYKGVPEGRAFKVAVITNT